MSDRTYTEDDVKHEKSAKTYSIYLDNGKKAILNYEEFNDSGQKSADLWHTEVPTECRGKGIAGILASKAITDLASNSDYQNIVLSCSYLQSYYKKNCNNLKDFSNIKL